MSVQLPVCPTGCSSILPAMDFDACAPEISFGEIRKIYLMAFDGANLLNWESLAVWVARIDNDDILDDDSIRELTVSADLPVGESDEIIISDNRRIASPKTFSINTDIDDVSDLNYDFMRVTECGTLFKMWYATEDKLFGGNTGITVNVNMSYLIERGFKSIQKITGTFVWESQFSPERTTNPMA